MDMMAVFAATAVISITGLLIGLLLGVAGKKFAVEVDEKEIAVRDLLPGNNCGGCGMAGCDAMAQAIAKGEAPVNGCPVAGPEIAKKILDFFSLVEVYRTHQPIGNISLDKLFL